MIDEVTTQLKKTQGQIGTGSCQRIVKTSSKIQMVLEQIFQVSQQQQKWKSY